MQPWLQSRITTKLKVPCSIPPLLLLLVVPGLPPLLLVIVPPLQSHRLVSTSTAVNPDHDAAIEVYVLMSGRN